MARANPRAVNRGDPLDRPLFRFFSINTLPNRDFGEFNVSACGSFGNGKSRGSIGPAQESASPQPAIDGEQS